MPYITVFVHEFIRQFANSRETFKQLTHGNHAIIFDTDIRHGYNYKKEENMINFEEELKRFKPSAEVEDAEDSIYNQDLDDMADVVVSLLKDARQQTDYTRRFNRR